MANINALRCISLSADQYSLLPRLVLYLTAVSMSLASCAFLLQWRGSILLEIQNTDYISLLEMSLWEGNISSTSSPGDCAEILGRNKEPSFPYYSVLPTSRSGPSDSALKICITATTSAGLEEILPWIFYHKTIGISKFFLFAEGKTASRDVAIVLESITDVKVIYRTFKELDELQAKSRVFKETDMGGYVGRPCNYELYVKQSLNMEMAIGMAREAGMDWIIHMDTDELLHPAGTKNYSVQELLSQVPKNIDLVNFPNYESCVERNDIKEPFSEVSMFKKNHHHLDEDTYYTYYNDVARGLSSYYLTYENYKSGARIKDDLLPLGAHEWYYYNNFNATAKVFKEAAILHYTYTKFSHLTSRRDRCNCKPTLEGVERCFMVTFDKDAFMIASSSTEEEMFDWYNEHVVWFDAELNVGLLQAGVLQRIYAPIVIIQGLKQSGTFAHVIASAWQKQPNENSSSSQIQSVSNKKFDYKGNINKPHAAPAPL